MWGYLLRLDNFSSGNNFSNEGHVMDFIWSESSKNRFVLDEYDKSLFEVG